MALRPIDVIDTRALFRPVSRELLVLLRALPADAWQRPTAAPRWRVRDVVAHMLDTTLRRLAFQRDRHTPPAPKRPLATERDLAVFVNEMNATWIAAAERFSPRILTELYTEASERLAEFIEHLPIDAPALFPVSWAGEADYAAAGWFDIGREFTELWHHQAQIRDTVGAPPLDDPAAEHAFLSIAALGLPHAYRNVRRADGDTLTLVVSGAAGGTWTIRRDRNRWWIWLGEAPEPTTRVTMSSDDMRRLLYNALLLDAAFKAIEIHGDRDLATPLLSARSVIV